MKVDFAAIVLAAGEGKRMKSSLPKVLHQISGKPLITKTVDTLREIDPAQIITVVSPKNHHLLKKVLGNQTLYAMQSLPAGTADATLAGLKKVKKNIRTVAILYGDDTAFYKPATILAVANYHRQLAPKITFVTLERQNPQGLGRVVRVDGKVVAIVEEKDATKEQKKIKEVNDGLYFFDKSWLIGNLPKVKKSKVTGEYYLPDAITIALKNGSKIAVYKLKDAREWHGINTPQELAEANRKLAKRIHIMGVAGAGAAGVAGIAKAYGFEVSGCDLNPQSAYTQNINLKIQKGHNAGHLKDIDILVISPAVTRLNPKNSELASAKELKIPIFTWQEFQGKYLQQGKFVIAVSGTYGKSTTTAMISQILIDAHLDPTCEVGAKVLGWGSNFRVGESKYYICEGDEYNNNFLNYRPDIAVILNVGWDHPDFFKTKEQVLVSYQKFIKRIKKNGILVFFDSPDLRQLTRLVSSDIKIVKIDNFGNLQLSIIGDFRKENAAAALTVARVLGLDAKLAKKSVESFKGIGRRLESKGKIRGVKFYDDYAVQPYTIKSTANAIQEKFKNQKVALVLEPHTFSRIETFFEDFVSSLSDTKVDRVFITNIYAAREKGDAQSVAQKLARSIGTKAHYVGTLTQTAGYLKKHLEEFDVILSMGAGDVYKLYDLIKND